MGMRVIVMAGGTGGHIFPALAVARVLQAQHGEITWLGAKQGMEVELVAHSGYPLELLSIKGLRGNGVLGWLMAPINIGRAILQAMRVLMRIKPQVVIGMGGFVAGPGGVAAWLLRIPLVIHEQNAIAGLTNRCLAKLATRVFFAFPQAFSHAANASKFHHCGNPVRQDIINSPAPKERLQGRQGPLRILLLGGSLGALVFNQTAPEALAQFALSTPITVRHQAGRQSLQIAQTAYGEQQLPADVVAFIDDMAQAYAWADIVICRAGALTIAELAAVGVAAILVPYPHAVDDHQTHNARYLSAHGAAVLLPQAEFTVEKLLALLQTMPRQHLLKMAQNSRALAEVKAAQQVADFCLQIGRS